MSAKARVLEALQAGPATTAQLCQPGVGGVRFGARIMELRIEGHQILERRLRAGSSLYTLVAGPVARAMVGDAAPGPVNHGAGHKSPWRRVWMCKRCAYREVDSPVCTRGHLATKGWSADLRPRPVQTDLPIAA